MYSQLKNICTITMVKKTHKNVVKNEKKTPNDPSMHYHVEREITSIVFITPLLVQVILGQPTQVLYL